MDKLTKRLAGPCAAALLALSATSAHAVPVDVELQLLVDVSGSVDTSEFNLQRTGYSDAFRSTAIHNAITGGAIGSIAVQLIYWSTGQAIGVDWTQLSSASESNAFADAIDLAARPGGIGGLTGPGSAINFGVPLFADNGFEGTSLVMDVSGDGTVNTGDDTGTASDNAVAGDIDRINGIAIGGNSTVEDFYDNVIVNGPDSFLLTADSFDDFGDAVALKLEAEIGGGTPTPVPLPTSILLFGIGLIGLGFVGRRRSRL